MASDREFSHEVLRGLSNSIESGLKRAAVCCPNCDKWIAFKELCDLYNARPPAPVIAFGCKDFETVKIPF